MTICERLFEELEQRGLSANGLCKTLGIGTNQTTNWKQRNTDPPAKYIIPICEYLGCSLHFLLTGEEAPETEKAPAPEISENGRRMLNYFEALEDGDQREAIGYVRGLIDAAAKKDRQTSGPDVAAKAV